MSEAIDEDLLNFDLLNDFDLNTFESFDQYLNNENNQPFGDRPEPNLALNPFHSYYHNNNNSNNGLNPTQNQWFHPYNGFNYEYNNQRFESNLFSIHTNRPQFHTNVETNHSVNPLFTTFGESSYYHNQNRNDQISEQLSFNGYELTTNVFNQKSSQRMIKSLVESSQSKSDDNPSEDLPESVTQLNGQLLSTQEFRQQNECELFCEEKIEENSTESPIDSNTRVVGISGVQKDDNNNDISYDNNDNNDNPLVIDEKIPFCYNQKTYSRKENGICKTSTVKKTDISKETIAAVKGLVMLSNSCRKTVIRSKAKKSYLSNLSFAERQRIKRERNRIAAKKCRQKKLETIEKLERMKNILVEENQQFEEYLKTKRQELIDMKLILLKHRLNDCHLKNK